jgi:RNA polymerase sigma factor (sigma-70 family)
VAEGLHSFVQNLARAEELRSRAGLSDAELLRSLVRTRDEASFELLVRRHAALVWRVCRGTLGNDHDAEDAFQATFLVFTRKAASIKPASMVGNWLYGTARNTAQKARSLIRKRQFRERQVAAALEPVQKPVREQQDLREIIDQELSHLSAKYRLPILLCDLDGLSRAEACQRLGWLDGTLSGRLARGRAMLARRLVRRGYGVMAGSGGGVCITAAPGFSGAPPALVGAVVSASKTGSTSALAHGTISRFAVILAGKVARSMSIAMLMRAFIATLVLATAVCGSGVALHRLGGEPPQEKDNASNKVKTEAKSERTETDCLNDMQAAAQKEWEIRMNQFNAGRGDLDHLYGTSGRLLKAALGMAKSEKDRVEALRGQLQRITEIEKSVRLRFQAAHMDAGSYEQAKFARSEAELDLIREGLRPGRERFMEGLKR